MRKYKVTYTNDNGETTSVILEAVNKTHLAMVVVEKITDIKDDDADNIIAVEET